MGRQLTVTTIIFFISYLLTFPESQSFLSHIIPIVLHNILIKSGLPGALITLIFGQIYPQLLADEYTLYTLDRWGLLISVKVAYILEYLGIFTSFSYLMQRFFNYLLCSSHHDHYYNHQHQTSTVGSDLSDDDSIFTDNITTDEEDTIMASSSFPPQQQQQQQEQQEERENINLFPFQDSSSTAENYEFQINSPSPLLFNSGDFDESHSSSSSSTSPLLDVICNEGCGSLSKMFISSLVVMFSIILVFTDIVFINPNKFGHPLVGGGLFLACMTVIFYLEGLQLAVLSVPEDISSYLNTQNTPNTPNSRSILEVQANVTTITTSTTTVTCRSKETDSEFKRAIMLQNYIQQKSLTVKRFFMGRQIFVVMTTFLASTICSAGDGLMLADRLGLISSSGSGSSDIDTTATAATTTTTTSTTFLLVSILCNPNIAAIIVLLNLVILPAQLFARKKPIHFFNLRGSMLIFKISLLLESLGFAHFSWYLFYLTKKGRLTDRYHTTNSDEDVSDTDSYGENAVADNFGDEEESTDRLAL